MIYQFKTGTHLKGLDAQTVGDELERIRMASDGRLETAEVVRWAAEPDSPIHKAFTWDNERAAHAHRLDQARFLIRAVVVVAKIDDVPQPAFWNVSVAVPAPESEQPATNRYYQSAQVIANSPDEFDAALKVMLREMAAAERGLEQLYRLAPRGKRKTAIKRATAAVQSAQHELTGLVPAKA